MPDEEALAARLHNSRRVAEKIHIPEVIEPDEVLPRDLLALRRFARLMDGAFEVPGTRARFGLDALLGLIPGIGDAIGALMSTWILAGALRHRVPALVLLRMTGNIVIDLLLGSIPVAGDLFDFLFEQNAKNIRLLEAHRDRRRPPRSVAGILLVIGAIVFAILLIAVAVIALLATGIVWLMES